MNVQWSKKKLIATSIASILLAGCGGGSDGGSSTPADPGNGSLSITSTAVTTATEDILYQYQLTTDYADAVSYSGTNLPTEMTLSTDGLLTWTPVENVLTSDEITINVESNSDNTLKDSQSFTIRVTPVNDPVVVSSIQPLSVESGQSITHQIQVTDPDDENNGTDILFSLRNAPAGLTVSPTGELSISSTATASIDHSVTVLVQDGLEDNAQVSETTFDLSELFYYYVNGQVASYYTNDVIPASTVKVSNDGQLINQGQTTAEGTYSIKVLDTSLDQSMPLIVSADAVGFSEASEAKSFGELSSDINLFLPEVHASVTFDSQAPSNLQVDNETLVTVEAQSFVNQQGEVVTGDISSELFIIDPSLDIDLMPGEMVTETPQGDSVPIESFGAITATFTDSEGNDLQLADGKVAEVRIPASGNNPPATIPLFYYDDIQGIWVEEGTATLENGYYVGQVSHFTTWNADRIYETIYVDGCVVDKEDLPIANARIRSEGVDYNGRSSAYSDDQGVFRIPVRQESTVLISAESNYQSRTETVHTNTTDKTITECLTLDDATTKIQLTWGENPRDLDTHFYGPDGQDGRFHVYFSSKSFNQAGNNIYLDVDDTSSYGPEIVTIPDYTVPGTYRYAVYKYTSSGAIQHNETKVELILEGNRTVFTPPEGTATRWWHVFEIEVAADLSQTLTPINIWSDTDPDSANENAAPQAQSRSADVTESKGIAETLLEEKYYAK